MLSNLTFGFLFRAKPLPKNEKSITKSLNLFAFDCIISNQVEKYINVIPHVKKIILLKSMHTKLHY